MVLLVAVVVSCSEIDSVDVESCTPIELSPSFGLATKAEGGSYAMSQDYDIWISSYLTDEEAGCGNSFTDALFTFTGEAWTSNPPHYWPIRGSLDFLALASDTDLTGLLEWDESRNTAGVTADLSAFDGSSECLYAAAVQTFGGRAPVSLVFSHTQALLEFKISVQDGIDSLDLVRLRGITVDASTAGVLTVQNLPEKNISWDCSGSSATSSVPVDTTDLTQTNISSIFVAPTEIQGFTLHLSQRASRDCDWDSLGVELDYAWTDPEESWEPGRKYTYNVQIGLEGILISAQASPIDDWQNETIQ